MSKHDEREDSAVSKARKDSPSLKTTIPEKVVKVLDVRPGDKLRWAIVREDGKQIAKVRRVRLIESD